MHAPWHLRRSNKFLRAEIHPISEGRDERDIARAVQRQQLVEIALTVPIPARLPRDRSRSAINPPDPFIDVPFQTRILCDPFAGGDHCEQVRDLPTPLGVGLKEPLERVELLRNPFRVIEAGDREQELGGARSLPHLREGALDGRADGLRAELRDVDPQGEDVHLDDAVARDDRTNPVVEPQVAQDAAEERPGVVVRVESNQVRTEESLEDLPVPWEETEDVVRREWDVQEESDAGVRNLLSDEARQEQEVIVVNPERIAALQRSNDFGRKAFVHIPIGVPFRRRVPRIRRERMEEGPERSIREASIVRSGNAVREEDGMADEFLLEARGDPPRFRRRHIARPSEPASSVFPVERREAGGDTARIGLDVEVVPGPPQCDWETIRDEEQGHGQGHPPRSAVIVRPESIGTPRSVRESGVFADPTPSCDITLSGQRPSEPTECTSPRKRL